MKRIKLFESFLLENNIVKIYHGSLHEEDAISILKNGWDESKVRGVKAEGTGMGAFFSINEVLYGNWTIEFDISVSDLRNYIIFDTGKNPYFNPNTQEKESLYSNKVIEFCKRINGRVETVEEQIKRINGNNLLVPNPNRWSDRDLGIIKGWITEYRFPNIMTIHLSDPSIAKPVRYFKNSYYS